MARGLMDNMTFLKSLAARIFAVFWLTLLLILLAVQLLRSSDPRVSQHIQVRANATFSQLAQEIAQQLTHSQLTLNQQLEAIQDDYSAKQNIKINFTSLEGELLDPPKKKLNRALRNFISFADDPLNPQQRLYEHWMLFGPFAIKTAHQPLLMYVGRLQPKPLPFYLQLMDDPLHMLLITMAVSTPLLLWLAWALTLPARRLQLAAEQVAKGKMEYNPKLELGPEEFKRAGASFNQMVLALNQMLSSQQRLLSDISHELRSPLTRLRMANALAQRKLGVSSELQRIDTESERMEQMIASLLALSRMQLNSHVERSSLNLARLWQPILEDAEFEAGQLGKTLSFSAIPFAELEGNSALLASALENVVRNAIKYAQTRIEITFRRINDELIVEVSDDGQGVPVEMLADIFRPFYRVSTARDRESGGSGLGLAITDTAMRQHRGQVRADTSPLGGLLVRLCLPLNAASKA